MQMLIFLKKLKVKRVREVDSCLKGCLGSCSIYILLYCKIEEGRFSLGGKNSLHLISIKNIVLLSSPSPIRHFFWYNSVLDAFSLNLFLAFIEPASNCTGLSREKWKSSSPQTAGLRCSPANNNCSGSVYIPAQQPSPPSFGSSHSKPASHVHLCAYYCCHLGLHQFNCSSLFPSGLLQAYHIHNPSKHSCAPGPSQCGAQLVNLCQRSTCSVSTSICCPVLHWCFQRICNLHWIPTKPYQD